MDKIYNVDGYLVEQLLEYESDTFSASGSKLKVKEAETDLSPDRLLKSPVQKKQKDDFQKIKDDSEQRRRDLDKKFIDKWSAVK